MRLRFPPPPIKAVIFNRPLRPPRSSLLLLPRHHLSHFPLFGTPTFPLPSANFRPSHSHLGIKQGFDRGKLGDLSVNCISSFNPAPSLDWNEPLTVSEVVGTEYEVSVGDEDEVDAGPSIPVWAYFFSTRSDIAWKNAKFTQIWEYLRDEFELTQRFHNLRFLQEILKNRKSDFLEWIIVMLIGAEILVSVYDIVTRLAIAQL